MQGNEARHACMCRSIFFMHINYESLKTATGKQCSLQLKLEDSAPSEHARARTIFKLGSRD